MITIKLVKNMKIVDLTDEYMNFVTNCTHNDENNEEISKVAKVRENWIRNNLKGGLKIKVAVGHMKHQKRE